MSSRVPALLFIYFFSGVVFLKVRPPSGRARDLTVQQEGYLLPHQISSPVRWLGPSLPAVPTAVAVLVLCLGAEAAWVCFWNPC